MALTDSTGAVVEKVKYDPYGTPICTRTSDNDVTAASHFGNPFLFQGQRYCPETGLYYFKNRDYTTTLGRLFQRDPIEYETGLNLYELSTSAPLLYLDPLGEKIEKQWDPTTTAQLIDAVKELRALTDDKDPCTSKKNGDILEYVITCALPNNVYAVANNGEAGNGANGIIYMLQTTTITWTLTCVCYEGREPLVQTDTINTGISPPLFIHRTNARVYKKINMWGTTQQRKKGKTPEKDKWPEATQDYDDVGKPKNNVKPPVESDYKTDDAKEVPLDVLMKKK